MQTTRRFTDIMLEIILFIFALAVFYPIFNIVMASFKESKRVYDLSLPNLTYFANYTKIFREVNLVQVFGNTLIICFATIALVIILSSMAGYKISRKESGIYRLVLILFMAGMIIPIQTSMIPQYKIGLTLHLLYTKLYLILLYVAGTIPFATIIYSGFTKTIPREIEEAASIDGSGIYRTFWSIVFPLLMPATGTIVVTTIFWYWNDFQGPLIFLANGQSNQTIILQIFNYKSERIADWGPIFALSTLATAPLLLFFMFTQKYLLRGLTAGGVKG